MNKKYMYATSAALLVLGLAGGIESAQAAPTLEQCKTIHEGCKKSAPSVFYPSKRKGRLEECTQKHQTCVDAVHDALISGPSGGKTSKTPPIDED